MPPDLTPDPVTACLDDLGKRNRVFGEGAAEIPRLVAGFKAVLKVHVQATTWGAALEGGRFDYCSTCSGHPAWPCPELDAISDALLGEVPTDG